MRDDTEKILVRVIVDRTRFCIAVVKFKRFRMNRLSTLKIVHTLVSLNAIHLEGQPQASLSPAKSSASGQPSPSLAPKKAEFDHARSATASFHNDDKRSITSPVEQPYSTGTRAVVLLVSQHSSLHQRVAQSILMLWKMTQTNAL